MRVPATIAAFLKGRRIAVAGVSRGGDQPSNLIFNRLRDSGYDVVPVNPLTDAVEGVQCYADLRAIGGAIDGLVIASPPASALSLVQQCADLGVKHVWFHRSFGQGSVDDRAVQFCRDHGIEPIVGGCPMMFCAPVDLAHSCMRWIGQRSGTVPR